MKRKTPWFEDDAFWAAFTPTLFGEERWRLAARDAEPLTKLLSLEPGVSVLDLCCGPGRFSVELARRGFRVTGVDRTALYLKEARKRARQQKLDVEFVREDMRRFVRPRAFDACINMFTSFGYFERQADDFKVCRNVYRSLRPGGRFLIQAAGKEWLARNFQPTDWREVDGNYILEERKVAPGWTGLENRWVLVRKGKVREFRFFLRVYSGVELRDLLLRAGFAKADIYGGLNAEPYDHNARWLVAVGRK
ncbi:class I SAM-dependent methyltransferase [candidate division WOR-3 bacterium]|nr:class I SAM-dependent methyltransferase [candidate division WOR-3 bacterium]